MPAPFSSTPPTPPTWPARYRPGPLLGEGGMGRVWRAWDEVLGAPVAIKVIRPDLLESPRVRERLVVETRMAARLTHPRLVPVHDVDTLPDGTPMLVTALAASGSLGAFRGDWPTLLRHVLDVLDALAALHAAGVLHRDLKPENVLLHHGQAWVSDLGLAEVADSLAARPGEVSGTPEFMAPEQRAGRTREFGPPLDLYALGRVLDRLTTGMAVPEGLDEVLSGLLATDPYRRFQLAADARRALVGLGPPALRRAPPLRAGGAAPTLYPSFVDRPPSSSDLLPIPTAAPLTHTPLPLPPAPVRPLLPTAPFLTPEDDPTLPTLPLPVGDPGLAPRLPPPPMPEALPPASGRGGPARYSLGMVPLRSLPLVGREHERARLWEIARRVRTTGRPAAVVLVGERGVGKTRLLRSLTTALEEGGWMETVALRWRDPPSTEDGVSGWARRVLRADGERPEALEERLVRAWQRDLGEAALDQASRMRRWVGLLQPGEQPVDRSAGRALLWERLRAAAWRGGTCLVLEDVALGAEDDALGLLRAVLDPSRGPTLPVLVLATVRAEALAADPELAAALDRLVASGVERIDLPRLDRATTAAFVDELLALTPDTAELVAARSEGNPLLARQLVTWWAAEGSLVEAGDLRYQLRPGRDAGEHVPTTAVALFRKRVEAVLERLDDAEAARRALHSLALTDEVLPGPVFATLAGSWEGLFLRAGLFRRERDSLAWDHGLLREAVAADAAARPDRARLHRHVAEAWLSWGIEQGVRVDDQVGQHLLEAGEPAAALPALLRACRRAEATGRAGKLLRLARAAVRAAGGAVAPLDAREAHIRLARALTLRGRLDEAAHELATAGFPDPRDERRGAVDTLPQSWFDLPVPDPVSSHAEAASDAYGAAAQGHLLRARGRLDDAAAAFELSLRRARDAEDPRLVGDAALWLAGCRRQGHDFAAAQALYELALDAYRKAGHGRGEAYALRELGVLAMWRGDGEEADRLYAASQALMRRVGEPVGEAVVLTRRAQRERSRGELDAAEQLLREAMHLFVVNGALLEVQNCRNDLADLARQRGDLLAARAGFEAALRWATDHGWREYAPIGRVNLALVAMAADAPEEARAEADLLVNALDGARNHWLRPFAEVVRAWAQARMGHRGEALRRLRQAAKRGLGAQADADLAWALGEVGHRAEAQGWEDVAALAAELRTKVAPKAG